MAQSTKTAVERNAVGSFMRRRSAPADRAASEPKEDADELTQYLSLPQEDSSDPDFDLLKFWAKLSLLYPNVARMARQFLCPPATTAGVERVFSRAGRMHGDLQKAVKEGTLKHSLKVAVNM